MPTNELDYKFMMYTTDGQYIGVVNEIKEITHTEESNENFDFVNLNNECEIEFKIKPHYLRRLKRLLMYQSNNYRKIHGIPMIRTIRSK
jgi:hypothetical protein